MNRPPYLTHDLLDNANIAHGFFTRDGGISQNEYNSLNCGFGSNDDHDNIRKNRHIAAAAIGGSDDKICGLYQVHSNLCHIADPITDNRPKGDGIVTNQKGITLAILTADCVPILFADHDAGIIGAAHAGWRGAIRGIVTTTLGKMKTLGASSENIKAVIGPAIQQKSYQVGQDLRDEVLIETPDAEKHFKDDSDGKWLFNLPGYVGDQLKSSNINYDIITADTYSDQRFFSHRRNTHEDGPDTGRLVSMIRLKT